MFPSELAKLLDSQVRTRLLAMKPLPPALPSPPLAPPIPFPLPPAALPPDLSPRLPAPPTPYWQCGEPLTATAARLLLSGGAAGRRAARGGRLLQICVGFATPSGGAQHNVALRHRKTRRDERKGKSRGGKGIQYVPGIR